MTSFDFSQERRQSVKGLILIFIQEGRKAIKMFWPILVPILFKKGSENRFLIIGAILLGGLLLTLVHAILFYRAYKFHVKGNQFILRKGYLNRKVLTIPLDRIQNVKTSQSVLQQALKVMSLEIDTAGSSQKELKIHALSADLAVQLARVLSSHLTVTDPVTSATGNAPAPTPEEQQILKLSNRDLLKIGLSQNHLRTALIIFAFGWQIFYQVKDYFEEKAKQYSHEIWDYLSQSGWTVIGLLVVSFILISFLYSMIRTLILFYDLRFLKMNQTYRIVSGLLNRKNLLIPFRKIQQIDWETGPVKKLFGIYRLNIRQANTAVATKTQHVEIPGCLTKHIEIIKTDLFGPDLLADQTIIRSSKIYFRRNWMYFGWIPAILASPIYFIDWKYSILGLTWLLFVGLLSHLTLKKSYFQVNSDQIRVSSGAIAHKFKQMEFHKVQHMEFRQSIFHRRRGVASLKIGNASGFIKVPFIDQDIAKSLFDYLLYYAETSNEDWM